MAIEVDVQFAVEAVGLPSADDFADWAGAALAGREPTELTVRVVGREESRELNAAYRGKDAPTNVLSFPADLPKAVGLALLGDIVICAPLVVEEARVQGKAERAHWAHLTVHGVLHLLGHDHQVEREAAEMEGLESRILMALGFPDPWSE